MRHTNPKTAHFFMSTKTQPVNNQSAAAVKAGEVELSNFSLPLNGEPSTAPKPKEFKEKLEIFYTLEKLFERRQILVEALDKVCQFQIGSTGGENLKLTDAKGHTFAISHPIIIGEMVSMAKSKLEEEIKQVERQFDF